MAMLRLFDFFITTAPDYEANEFVAFPFDAVLHWPMGTPAGFTTFINAKVNAQIKKIFDVWTQFLVSPESCYILSTEEDGWFGPAASIALPNFAQTFICDPNVPA